jgi:hypothetical protein
LTYAFIIIDYDSSSVDLENYLSHQKESAAGSCKIITLLEPAAINNGYQSSYSVLRRKAYQEYSETSQSHSLISLAGLSYPAISNTVFSI